MFDKLSAMPPDAIMALMEQAKADTNPKKVDLGVGIYKDNEGRTPVMRAVKSAERRWLDDEDTKKYVSTTGRPEYREALLDLMFGTNPALRARMASAQAAGGSGALRLGAELIQAARPGATVWASTPTWANHVPLISSAGLKMESYPYYDRKSLSVTFEAMVEHLRSEARPGDVVLLHGCCHNPTGADLSREQWDDLAPLLADLQLLPFVDLAYLGLGEGLQEDLYGLHKIAAHCPEVLVSASCSKNFGLYRDRVGLIVAIAETPDIAKIAQSQFGSIQRKIISMPPDHGAALVGMILTDEALRAEWEDELTEMRNRMIGLRKALADALEIQGGSTLANAVRSQNGMFSTLPMTKTQAETLRSKHSVYMTNSGRMNVAGYGEGDVEGLARALLDVLG